MRFVVSLLAVSFGLFTPPGVSRAQDAPIADPPSETSSSGEVSPSPTAADRSAASATYDRASAAFLAGQFARAAELFETAYRIVPNSVALVQAIRARLQNGEVARASTLAARMMTRYPGDPFESEAEQVVNERGESLLRLRLRCAPGCVRELDGVIQDNADEFIFTHPGEHRILFTFESGEVLRVVAGDAGELVDVRAEPPTRPEPAERAGTATPTDGVDGGSRQASGLDPALFAVLTTATAVSGGVLIAFSVDAWSGVADYDRAPTEMKLRAGQDRELRTNIMFGVTGALALGALIAGLFTDWDGDAPGTPALAASANEEGLFLSVRGVWTDVWTSGGRAL